jgi:hypothetical protein
LKMILTFINIFSGTLPVSFVLFRAKTNRFPLCPDSGELFKEPFHTRTER